MTFDELLEEVYIKTNRPDLEAETKSAVKAATLKAHRSDYFSKDIYETGVEFNDANYRQALDYATLITNFRAFKYFRRVENATDDNGIPMEILTPEALLDSYGIAKTDIAYVAGRVLELRASVSFKYGLLGVYVLPIVTEDKYSSWIAELYPYAIVYEAARVVFRVIGQLEESNGMAQLMAEEYSELSASNIQDIGY